MSVDKHTPSYGVNTDERWLKFQYDHLVNVHFQPEINSSGFYLIVTNIDRQQINLRYIFRMPIKL